MYEETLTLRIGKEELVYYADKSKKNKDKHFVHAISIIDFSKDDPFSGSTTIPSDAPFPSFSPMKTSDSTFEEFIDEFTLPNSLPPGNDDSTLKKDLHEKKIQVYSNPLFEFDDNFKSSNVNPLFEENNKDVEIKSSFSFTLTSPEESEFEAYLERDSIPPGIDLTFPPTLEVSSSNPTSLTLTGEKVCSWKMSMFFSLVQFVRKMMKRNSIRKKIICLLATYLHQKPKPLSRPQEVEEIKEKEDKVSSEIPIDTIVMPIRITFDNPIAFNDHFSKPKKDLPISFDSITTNILPSPLFDSDSSFTVELSVSVTLNSLGNEDKVFKPDSSYLLPPPEPPDKCLNFEPILVMKNVVLNEDFYQRKKTTPLHVEDVNTFAFVFWTFLPYFTYTEESPLIFSFRRRINSGIESSLRLGDKKQAASWEFTPCLSFSIFLSMIHPTISKDSRVRCSSTLIETNKALLKDEEAKDVDVHLYKSVIGSLMYLTTSRPDIMFVVCSCARIQVTPKVSHLHAVKRIFRYLKDETVYKEWEDRMERAATTASSIEAEQDSEAQTRFALSKNPTIYDSHIKQFWQTATVNTLDNEEQEITATLDGHVKTVTIAYVRKYLKLADVGGLSSLPNTEIFDQLSLMGETIRQEVEIPQSNFPTQTPVADEAAFTGVNVVKKLEQTVQTSQARRRAKIVVSDDEEDEEDPSKQGRSLIEEMDLDARISLVPPQVSTAVPEVTTVDAELNTASTFVSTASLKRIKDTTYKNTNGDQKECC
ncbi:hypothetical protein Tco_0154752 [Tanacetum coccineum]